MISRTRKGMINKKFQILRSKLRKVDKTQALQVVHAYTQFMQDNIPLPNEIAAPPPRYQNKNALRLACASEWQLELLAREILALPDTEAVDDIRSWPVLAEVLNLARKATDSLYTPTKDPTLILNRTCYQQFHWQRGHGNQQACRYLGVFGQPDVDEVVRSVYGFGTRQLILLAYAIAGVFSTSFSVSEEFMFGLLGGVDDIDQPASETFFLELVGDFTTVRNLVLSSRSLDEHMLYGSSPFIEKPLIRAADGSVICPIPYYLSRRTIEGVYYRCLNNNSVGRDEFNRRFGAAFEGYVIELLNKHRGQVGEEPVHGEVLYGTRVRPKKTTDVFWRAVDRSVLIECKSARMTVTARMAGQLNDQISTKLSVIVDGILKFYETVWDSDRGAFVSPIDLGGEVFGLVVTFEEWILVARSWQSFIDNEVTAKLDLLGVPSAVRERIFYSVVSADELEKLVFLIQRSGDTSVLVDLVGDQRWHHAGNRIEQGLHSLRAPFVAALNDELEALMD